MSEITLSLSVSIVTNSGFSDTQTNHKTSIVARVGFLFSDPNFHLRTTIEMGVTNIQIASPQVQLNDHESDTTLFRCPGNSELRTIVLAIDSYSLTPITVRFFAVTLK
jgi:hypothetical protein